ncbi:MAG: hypothetical protein QOE70_3495 [Chthoniobacter sp.]|nr:hypothetical protein [Chthoniobacter sp.]
MPRSFGAASFRKDALRRVFFVVALAPIAFVNPAAAADELRPWTEYRAIMWIGDSAYKKPEKLPLFFQRLREMGINAAMVHHDAPHPALLEAKLPYYVENLVNRGLCLKWNSGVTDWDKHVTAWKDGRSDAGLVREFCLDDPAWQKWARDEMQRLVRVNMTHQPLAYDIRDELSVTMSANPFDYDFAPAALAGFRQWLQTQYADLAALNAQWDTDFPSWDEVKPFTTDQIKNRMAGGVGPGAKGVGIPIGKPDWQALQKVTFDPVAAREHPLRWNFSPWCDHRTYMDLSLARTLGDLRDAAHELDPHTPVGIEGTQMPAAFGGYDLWRLSQVLDWVEPYDVANAREIWGSFMPGKPILSTVGEQDARAAKRRLWHLLLEGDKGCIVWWSEDCIDWNSEDYALTPRAKALTPVLAELTSPLARLFLRAEREVDPIAIHYSQASIQVDWLLESAVDGSTWLRRFSSYEASNNQMALRRQAWVKAFQDFGYTPQFVSSEQLEHGQPNDIEAIVVADSLARSFREKISARQQVGSELAGLWDEHGKFQPGRIEPPRFELTPNEIRELRKIAEPVPGNPLPPFTQEWDDVAAYLQLRVQGLGGTPFRTVERLVFQMRRPVLVPPKLCIRTHRYKLGNARLLAFERNIVWQMGDDLKQKGGNEALEKPVQFDAQLAAPAHVYDLRSGKYLGHRANITVDLDPWQPSLYAITKDPLVGADIVAALTKLAIGEH